MLCFKMWTRITFVSEHSVIIQKGAILRRMILFLDMPVEKLEERGGYGKEHYEKLRLQRKARLGFLQFRKRSKDWITFDAEQDETRLSFEILKYTSQSC